MKKMPLIRSDLKPAFAASAIRRTSGGDILLRTLRVTSRIRSEILLPASKNRHQIQINFKENAGQIQDRFKCFSIATDHQCEEALMKGLQEEFPGCYVLGEEAFGEAETPARLDMIGEALKPGRLVFVTDALDGTRSFRYGHDRHSVMVAAMRDGAMVAGAIHVCENHSDPMNHGHTLTWSQDDCVRIDGRAVNSLSSRTLPSAPEDMSGYGITERDALSKSFLDLYTWTCGRAYAEMLRGHKHFLVVKPPVDLFDYSVGVALIQAAGGVARFVDGVDATFAEITRRQSYTHADHANIGNMLIFAVSEDVYGAIRTQMLESRKPVQVPAPRVA